MSAYEGVDVTIAIDEGPETPGEDSPQADRCQTDC